jgi:hypothetical protein
LDARYHQANANVARITGITTTSMIAVELISRSRSADAIGPCGSSVPSDRHEARSRPAHTTGQRSRRERRERRGGLAVVRIDASGPFPLARNADGLIREPPADLRRFGEYRRPQPEAPRQRTFLCGGFPATESPLLGYADRPPSVNWGRSPVLVWNCCDFRFCAGNANQASRLGSIWPTGRLLSPRFCRLITAVTEDKEIAPQLAETRATSMARSMADASVCAPKSAPLAPRQLAESYTAQFKSPPLALFPCATPPSLCCRAPASPARASAA